MSQTGIDSQVAGADEIFVAAEKLPPDDRARLADRLLVTLGSPPLSPAWQAEIQRRLDEYHSGKVETIPSEQVMRELREKYGR